jgi:hypothetical protein
MKIIIGSEFMPKENPNKILAYELGYDMLWEPGLPPKDDPSYISASYDTERAESRRIGLTYDVWINVGAFPEHEYVEFTEIPPPGRDIYCWDIDHIHTLPNPVLFFGLMAYLPFLDYPYIENRWPIVSQEMFEVLTSVKDFKYKAYPTVIRHSNEAMHPYEPIDNFVILQTLEFLDAFDFDKSEYVMDEELIGHVEKAEKVVIKEPPGGLPPMFRLKAQEFHLYVSAAAKEALEAAGKDRGIRFVPVDENYHW